MVREYRWHRLVYFLFRQRSLTGGRHPTFNHPAAFTQRGQLSGLERPSVRILVQRPPTPLGRRLPVSGGFWIHWHGSYNRIRTSSWILTSSLCDIRSLKKIERQTDRILFYLIFKLIVIILQLRSENLLKSLKIWVWKIMGFWNGKCVGALEFHLVHPVTALLGDWFGQHAGLLTGSVHQSPVCAVNSNLPQLEAMTKCNWCFSSFFLV